MFVCVCLLCLFLSTAFYGLLPNFLVLLLVHLFLFFLLFLLLSYLLTAGMAEFNTLTCCPLLLLLFLLLVVFVVVFIFVILCSLQQDLALLLNSLSSLTKNVLESLQGLFVLAQVAVLLGNAVKC